jgi:DNA-binding LacI/PurR family transcriptional regulator
VTYTPLYLYDDEAAAREITELLINKGHRRIGVISGFENSYHTQKRLTGYQKALKAANIGYDSALVLYGDWRCVTKARGRRKLGETFRNDLMRPSKKRRTSSGKN